MDISVQYLEGGTEAVRLAPAEARSRLRDAFERLPLARVMLGWDLPLPLVEACADECERHHCDLYLWQPMLSGHGRFTGDPRWRVVGPAGEAIAPADGKLEFSFFCPNHPDVRESVLRDLDEALAGGHYQGVFLDRIRFPSPASDFARHFGCFCDSCQAAARELGLDLEALRGDWLPLLATRDGRHDAISALFRESPSHQEGGASHELAQMLDFRQRSVSLFVRDIAETVHVRGLKVGLDCFSPTLARMVGQDLPALSGCSDWIKVMTYARLFAPASLSYEIAGLADWLASFEGETEQAALDFLRRATGWALPPSRETIRGGGLPASILTSELGRGRSSTSGPLLAGIELVDIPGVADLSPSQLRSDAEAVHAAAPDGVVLCWDLLRIPSERLDLAASLYG